MANPQLRDTELKDLRDRIGSWTQPGPGAGRVDREMFRNEMVFELEMRHLFEGDWVYVAHESQLPKPHSFYSCQVGRQPLLLTRDKEGKLLAHLNVCSHRGALVCRERAGVRKTHTCGFHGWVYGSAGQLLGVTGEEKGAYPPDFQRGELGLRPVKLESYRGFIFVSLNRDVAPLAQFLGGATLMIDLIIDQSLGEDWEVLPGTTSYTYRGNWKLSAENGIDGYHVGSVHASYVDITMNRIKRASATTAAPLDLSRVGDLKGGYQYFDGGHAIAWTPAINEAVRPAFTLRPEYVKRFGEARAQWMLGRLRNLLVAPNCLLMDSMSTQIRRIEPISVNETRVTTWCFAPKGESAEARARRIRQYEDFYNVTGLATPDDLTEFNACQAGFAATGARWSDISRGTTTRRDGPGGDGDLVGSKAVSSADDDPGNEGVYVAMYKDWTRRMIAAIDRELGR